MITTERCICYNFQMINKNKNIDCKIACDNLNLHPQSDAPNV